VTLGGLLVALSLAGYYLAGPIRAWLAQAPASMAQTQARIRRLLFGTTESLVAVPLLATFKILCDHIEALRPAGAFLGE